MPGQDAQQYGESDHGHLGYQEMPADHARTEMQADSVRVVNQHELPNVAH